MRSLFYLLFFLLISCQTQETKNAATNTSESFLPMQIGNSWKNDEQNFTEIKDTVKINGETYYQFNTLVGGDALATTFLRIDEKQQLWESWPDNPEKKYLHAKFGAGLNETFYTLGDKSTNDYLVTVTEKSPERMTFSFTMVNHPDLNGPSHTVTYTKGKGYEDNWKEVKINGKTVK